jgi:cytochrome c
MTGTLLAIAAALAITAVQAHAGPLHDAAKAGDAAAIAAALDAGAGVDDSDGMGPALYHAARRGHVDAARLLVQRGAGVNAPSKMGTPLSAAAARGSAEIVDLLLSRGADPDVVHAGATPLFLSVRKNCLPCVESLVAAGADVNWRNAEGETALHIARVVGYGAIDAYLAAHGAAFSAPPPVSARLGSADVARGERLFRSYCQGCHTADAGAPRKEGAPLWGILGRPRAASPGFRYSAALRSFPGTWGYEDLNAYLSAPMAMVPGITMAFPGLPDEADRVDLIAWLRTRSDTPLPLP